MLRLILVSLTCIAFTSSCSSEIYLRDGVTDGDTFYLSQQALTNSGPVLQSWVSYSLTRSACQLQLGGANPARMNSFNCELTARRHLVETWLAKGAADGQAHDAYLESLAEVKNSGYLDEYVARYFAEKGWVMPGTLESASFNGWRHKHLRRHQPETRIIGSWNYAREVRSAEMGN